MNLLRHNMSARLRNARQRCSNPNNGNYKTYGGRGIKCFISLEDLITLWNRDNAHKMEIPSIDRIDNDGDYIFDNCRFIELRENTIRANVGTKQTVETKRKIGNARKIPKGKWALWAEKCVECGTTDKRHRARSLCEVCYSVFRYELKKELRKDNHDNT